jgi:hypothetical protein
VSPVKYEMCFYIPEGDILHSHRRDNQMLQKVIPLTIILLLHIRCRGNVFNELLPNTELTDALNLAIACWKEFVKSFAMG